MNNSDQSFDRNQYMPPQGGTAGEPQAGSSFVTQQPPAANTEPSVPTPVSEPPAGAGGNAGTTQSEPPAPKKGVPGPVIAGALVLLLIIGIIGFVLSRQQSNPANANQQTQTQQTGTGQEKVIPTIDASRPAVSFTAVEGMGPYKVGDEVTFQIMANSQGSDIHGYDLLFPYDKESVEILETKSASPSFQIFAHDRGDYYAVTGLKLLSVTTPTAFDNTPILEMKVKAKKPGTYYLEMLPERGKETSKFVDKDITVIQPQIQPIKLEIQ